jgi:hypothetical protein
MLMDREQFEDLMLTDQKTFANYAGLFMDLKGTQVQGFLDWCWEKYLDEARPTPNSTLWCLLYLQGSAGTTCFGDPAF